MFAGHFGLAAAVKAKNPQVPLWTLMLGTQLLDVIFVPFLLTGKETMEPVPGAEGYGGSIIHADYTHSLVGTLIIAMAVGWLASRKWGRKGGWTIGAVVLSHWALDLAMHRADLPILPGNAGGLPLLGLGLWQWTSISMAAELALVTVGAILYVRSLPDTGAASVNRSRNLWTGAAMCALLLLSLATDTLGWG
ncbi:permease [Paenibacillus sp. D51F]